MLFSNVKRIIRFGFQNFIRSGFTSIASVLVMTITLFVITSLIFVQASLNVSLTNIENKVDVTVYFVPGAKEPAIKNIENSLKKLPEVQSVTYTSQAEALTNFKERHADDYLTLQALDELGGNPLGASLNIRAQNPSQYGSIAAYFKGDNSTLSKGALTIVDKIDYYQNKTVINKLTSIINGANRLGFVISLIFILISIIITFNTIKIIIFMSREEIGVMRLVGASKKYIQGPFIISGILVGITASLLTILLFIPISIWLGNQMTNFLGINLYTYFKSNFLQLFIIMLVSGVLLGGISSALATARYLRR